MKRILHKVFNEQKFFRRLILIWVLVILTHWSLFMMNEELLKTISPAGATVVTGIFGMLTTVIGFYQWHRKADDDKERELSKRKETENDSE